MYTVNLSKLQCHLLQVSYSYEQHIQSYCTTLQPHTHALQLYNSATTHPCTSIVQLCNHTPMHFNCTNLQPHTHALQIAVLLYIYIDSAMSGSLLILHFAKLVTLAFSVFLHLNAHCFVSCCSLYIFTLYTSILSSSVHMHARILSIQT